MPVLPIVKYPDQRLKVKAEPIVDFNEDLRGLIKDMFSTMYDAEGIGLAAPQVGVGLRVVVIDVSRDGSQKIELVNPEIISSNGKKKSEEGCLSIPDYRDTIMRHEIVKVKACDGEGNEFTLDAGDILAVCLQHEIDHLDGILFIDQLSRLKKQMFQMWYKKNGPFE